MTPLLSPLLIRKTTGLGERGVGLCILWTIFVFLAAVELRCLRKTERTAGRENKEHGAALVS